MTEACTRRSDEHVALGREFVSLPFDRRATGAGFQLAAAVPSQPVTPESLHIAGNAAELQAISADILRQLSAYGLRKRAHFNLFPGITGPRILDGRMDEGTFHAGGDSPGDVVGVQPFHRGHAGGLRDHTLLPIGEPPEICHLPAFASGGKDRNVRAAGIAAHEVAHFIDDRFELTKAILAHYGVPLPADSFNCSQTQMAMMNVVQESIGDVVKIAYLLSNAGDEEMRQMALANLASLQQSRLIDLESTHFTIAVLRGLEQTSIPQGMDIVQATFFAAHHVANRLPQLMADQEALIAIEAARGNSFGSAQYGKDIPSADEDIMTPRGVPPNVRQRAVSLLDAAGAAVAQSCDVAAPRYMELLNAVKTALSGSNVHICINGKVCAPSAG